MSKPSNKSKEQHKHPFTSSSHHQSSTDTSNTARNTTTVRHRLPKRKVNSVWKPLSAKTCHLLQESLARAIKETKANEEYPSVRRIEALANKLTSQMRVPVGVYTGIKLNQEGKVDLVALEDLRKKNTELESLLQLRKCTSSALESSKN